MRGRVLPAGALFLAGLLASAADAAGDPNTGLYLLGEVGQQQIIGGAQLGGVDVLASDVRTVSTAALGLRLGFLDGWVVGWELGYGKTDGDLQRIVPGVSAITIDYRNDEQTHLGMHLGHTVGDDWLVFGYASEVTRQFSVTLTDGFAIWHQDDEQGILRYGLGVERRSNEWFRVRATLGSARADFSGPTDGEPGAELEFALGIVLTL